MKALTLREQAILLKYEILDKEAYFEKLFMEEGPSELCQKLGIKSFTDPNWQVVFDYFVIHKNVFSSLVKRYSNHFKDLYEDYGPSKLREMLFISDKKYDHIWRPIHDLVGIAEGSLLKYAYNNRFSLNRLFHVHGSAYLRKYLFLDNKNYDETWENILNIMLQTTTQGYFSSRVIEEGIKLFDAHFNLRRVSIKLDRRK